MVEPKSTTAHHDPVMLDEVLELLNPQPGEFIIDATLGLGGHTSRILSIVGPTGTVMGVDWDIEMLEIARQRLNSDRMVYREGDYRKIPEFVAEFGKAPNGILLDLGLNSAQIDNPSRGMSFQHDAPLDLRMNRSGLETGAALLNRLGEDGIEKVLREFGGERFSRQIARELVALKKTRPIATTFDLVEAVMNAIPPKYRDERIHPATRAFQAVRIAVNSELSDLEGCIFRAAQCLAPGGTMVVIAYHDGEDRPAKLAFRSLAQQDFVELTRKPLVPTPEEIARNRRSRSAKLRAIRRK